MCYNPNQPKKILPSQIPSGIEDALQALRMIDSNLYALIHRMDIEFNYKGQRYDVVCEGDGLYAAKTGEFIGHLNDGELGQLIMNWINKDWLS